MPLQSNRNHRRLAAGVPLTHPYAVPRIPPGPAGPLDRRRARGSPPSRPSRRARASAVPATRWRARSGCSGRCWARSSRSRPGPSCSSSSSASGGARSPSAAATRTSTRARRGARAARPRDRRARPRQGGGRRQGVHALLPARQPRRGAAADPRPADRARGGPRRADRRFHRRGGRPAAADPRSPPASRTLLNRRRGPPGAHRAPHRGPPAHAAGRPAPHPPPARPARRPEHDPRRGRRPAAPAARGDLDPVAHRRGAVGHADAAGRGPVRARDLRRDAVHGRARLPARDRPGARSAAPDPGRARARGSGIGAAYAADAGRTGTHPVLTPALLRFGSWIGADRDGHPGVTRTSRSTPRASRPTTCSAATRRSPSG